MAFPTIDTPSLAYHRPASFQYVYARPSGGLYQTLGAVKEATLKLAEYKDTDSLGKNKSFAVEFTASCKLKQSSLTTLELLDAITAGTVSFLFKMQDAGAIPTGAAAATEGWVLVTAAQIGAPKWTVVYDGTPQDECYILMEWQGSLLKSEVDAAVKASIEDVDFEATGGSGTLMAIGTYTAALNGGLPTVTQILPAGVSSITLAEPGGAAQTLGAVKNVKIQAAAVDDGEDDLRRFMPHAVAIDISYEWAETDAANLLNLADMTDTEIDAVITMKNGVVWTLSNTVGISLEYESGSDFQKKKIVRFMHTGQILTTAFDGIVS